MEHKPDSPPCMETLLTTAREVASGLAFLHSKDILHCDISGGRSLALRASTSWLSPVAKLRDVR